MKKTIKYKTIFDQIAGKLSFIVLILQIAFLVIFNLFFMHNVIDTDSSSVMVLAREMARQGRIFPKDYSYQATLDLHGMSLLTAFFYRIIGNIRLAQGLANCVIIFIFLYLVFCVLRRIEMSGIMKNLVAILYFIPWTTGQLGSIRMTFLGGAFYVHRTIVPILLIGIILDQEQKIAVKHYLIRFFYLIFVCFINGVSSGPFVMLCSIAPVFAYELVRSFLKDDYSWFRSKRFITEMIAVASSMAGVVVLKIIGFNGHISEMTMINSSRLMNNIGACITGFFGLFGGSDEAKGIALGSAQSINIIVGFCFTMILLFSLGYSIFRMIRKKEDSLLNGYAVSLLVCNFLVYSLVDTRYASECFEFRYHLISLGLAFYVFAEVIEVITDQLKKRQYIVLRTMIFALIGMALLLGNAKLFFYGRRYNIEEMKKINAYLEDNNMLTAYVFGLNDEDMKVGRTLRPYSERLLYLPITEDLNNLDAILWGGPKTGLDNSEHAGGYAVVTKEEYLDKLPDYVKNRMNFKQKFEAYSVYSLDNDPFDLEGGMNSRSDHMVDFPYSPGYEVINGYVNDNGELVSSGKGGELLRANYVGVKGDWEYTVHGKVESGDGDIRLLVNDVQVLSGKLMADNESIYAGSIDLNGDEKITVIISCDEDADIRVSDIEMNRISY